MDIVCIWKVPSTPTGASMEPVSLGPEVANINAASLALPEGVYTTFRTFDGRKILPIDPHLARLEESARLLDRPISLDKELLLAALGQALQNFREAGLQGDLSAGRSGDARVRVSVDLQADPGTLYLALETLHVPSPENYLRGIQAVTIPFHRENPRAKQTDFINIAEAARRNLPPNAYEALMLSEDGQILEGLSSNFFAVRDGVLFTAAEGVLRGVARAMTLDAAQEARVPVQLSAVSSSEIPAIHEAFITSSSRGILPIHQIDRTVVGSGKPGPVTQTLSNAYWRAVAGNLIAL